MLRHGLTYQKKYHAPQTHSQKGGGAADLSVQTPALAKLYNVISSFDTHAKISEHFDAVNTAAKEAEKVTVISVEWDPGMFALDRMYAGAILSNGCDYTFWSSPELLQASIQ